jgi:hypothetical protein
MGGVYIAWNFRAQNARGSLGSLPAYRRNRN